MSAPELSRALAERWFQKAENDLLNVENNLKAERYPADTVCFHCQQAAEKYLSCLCSPRLGPPRSGGEE